MFLAYPQKSEFGDAEGALAKLDAGAARPSKIRNADDAESNQAGPAEAF